MTASRIRAAMVSVVGAWVLVALFAGAGTASAGQAQGPPATQGPHITIRLSDATPPAPAAAPASRAASAPTPLTQSEIDRVLSILRPLDSAPRSTEGLVWPARGPEPPPLAGATQGGTLPPPPLASAPTPFAVSHHAPEGPVRVAAVLSIGFSRPAAPLASVEALRDLAIPVRLTPQPPGRWRWVEPSLLVFEPQTRFPMATDYEVEVAAGTAATDGSRLSAPVRWTFSTPAPTVVRHFPPDDSTPVLRDGVVAVEFDQRVDPARVLPLVRMEVGGRAVALRLATPLGVAAANPFPNDERAAHDGRIVGFVPDSPLPADAHVDITIGPGVPSTEGPKTSADPHSWRIRTPGPLKMLKARCNGCDEGSVLMPEFDGDLSLLLQFSNPLDADTVLPGTVRVEPPMPHTRLHVNGETLVVSGIARARTTYTVTVSARVTDQFGQSLGREEARTFDVGPRTPRLHTEWSHQFVVDPSRGTTYPVHSINCKTLRVRLYPASIDVLAAFTSGKYPFVGLEEQRKPILSWTVAVHGRPDEWTETAIDYSAALRRGTGQFVLAVQPEPAVVRRWARMHSGQRLTVWVQATHIGLAGFADKEEVLGWASSLDAGAPLAGVELSLFPSGVKGVTGPDGLVRLPLSAGQQFLVARRGDDMAILPEPFPSSGESAEALSEQPDEASSESGKGPRISRVWFVFSDRGVYRPGEEVRLKGWVRSVGFGKHGDVAPAEETSRRVLYRALNEGGQEFARGAAELNAFGGFDVLVKIPPSQSLVGAGGRAWFEFNDAEKGDPPAAGNWNGAHRYGATVADYVVSDFETTTITSKTSADPPDRSLSATTVNEPHVLGETATVTVAAHYYSGGGVPGARVEWTARAERARFAPPGRGDYSFGRAESPQRPKPADPVTHVGVTDTSGRHNVRVEFAEARPPAPFTVDLRSRVLDANRRDWTTSQRLLVHPARLYVGLRTDAPLPPAGARERLGVRFVVTDIPGQGVAGRPVVMRAVHRKAVRAAGRWTEVDDGEEECRAESSTDESSCAFSAERSGRYVVTATVTDLEGRPNQTEISCWIREGDSEPRRRTTTHVEGEDSGVRVLADKTEYAPGDVAVIRIVAPFPDAEGLLTLRRSGVIHAQPFRVRGTSAVLRVTMEDAWTPGVEAHVALVGSAPDSTDASARVPVRAEGSAALSLPPVARTLDVRVSPRDRLLPPGGRTIIDAEVRDRRGIPQQGVEVALLVVDEAVLAETGYATPNPVPSFYPSRPPNTKGIDIRLWARLPEWPPGFDGGVIGGVKGGVAGGMPIPPTTRVDFNPLAAFVPSSVTDAAGAIHVPVTLRDSLTRYRVMAIAASKGAQFGSGESSIVAGLPLALRASPPRFVNVGDRFELTLMVQNRTAAPQDVDVAVRAKNVRFTNGAGRRVRLAAGDRAEIRFPAEPGDTGVATVQAGAVTATGGDAVEFQVPVTEPATLEAFAAYGRIDQAPVAYRVKPPANVLPGVGGLEITTGATALQALTDSIIRVRDTGDCSEQIASRILAAVALQPVLVAVRSSPLDAGHDISTAISLDLGRLQNRQAKDGSFPLWEGGDADAWPYLGIHVAHALQRALEAKYLVWNSVLGRTRQYLRNIEKAIPSDYPVWERKALVAYALYVRALMGDGDPARARRLVGEGALDDLPIEAAGWLLGALAGDTGSQAEQQQLRTFLSARVVQTAGAAHFAVAYGEWDYLLFRSSRRADAVVLEALIRDQPASPLVPKLMEGILPRDGLSSRWNPAVENPFVLLAAERYFRTYERTAPDFTASLWLNGRFAASQAFKGAGTARSRLMVGLPQLGGRETALVMSKQGTGSLYYRVGLRYAPADFNVAPLSQGFTVSRAYSAIDDPADVTRDASGTWRIKAGARVRVTLTLESQGRRQHVALLDPLPAGLEPFDFRLEGKGTRPEDRDSASGAWRSFRWSNHDAVGDRGASAYAALLPAGIYRCSYVAHAVTPGVFRAAPPHVEEMYHPETFGRGSLERVEVYER
jgi:alpha-2-macroglobulin